MVGIALLGAAPLPAGSALAETAASPYLTPSSAYGDANAPAPSPDSVKTGSTTPVPSAAHPSAAYGSYPAVTASSPAAPLTPGAAYDAPQGTLPAPSVPSAPESQVPGSEAPAGNVIRDIRVRGNQRIESATIETYLLLKRGDPFDTLRMDRSLKELFATGLFSNVVVRREGDVLVVEVEENPIINQLVFEGNSKIETSKLEAEIDLRPRVVYTPTKVQNAVRRILELYQRSGRFGARVEPKIIRLPQNRVNLVFEITEGDITGIKEINFVGNRAFSDMRLRSVIATKETAWWRFLTMSDTYDPDRLAFDRDALRRFYLSNGYADFTVISAVAEMAPDRSGFYITFTVEEGERYKIGKIEVVSDIKELDVEQLRGLIELESGDWFDGEAVEEAIDRFTDKAGELGYAFVDIKPRSIRDRENRLVNITFHIGQAPRVYIERINIVGNTRTLDRVIRREFRVVEGDAFNLTKLTRSETRIKNLGFFEDVKLTHHPGSRPDLAVVDLEVREQSTGEFSLGAGFSSSQGALGTVGIRERNFLGRGQDVRLNFTLAQRVSSLDFGFTEPYFLDRDVAAGFDAFRTEQDFSDFSSFEQNSLGFSVRFGYNLSELLRHTLSYTLRKDDLQVDDDLIVSPFILDQEGERSTSAIAHALVYDTRDDRFDPTRGWFASLSNVCACLFGGGRYLRSEVRSGYWYPLDREWVLSANGRVGYIFGFNGRDVRVTDRFFLGGDSLRGFEPGGVGPRDVLFNDALGANQVYNGTVELRFPTPLPEELGINFRVFTDFGTAKKIDGPGSVVIGGVVDEVVDKGSLRASAGLGATWKSPFGPVRVDMAVPYKKEDFDRKQLFRISFGTRF